MKFFLYIFCLSFLLISCKNGGKDQQTNSSPAVEQQDRELEESKTPQERKITGETSENTSPEATEENSEKNSNNEETIQSNIYSGIFVKEEENDADCSCYCIEITNGETDLCLQDQEIYIKARITENGEKKQLYFIEPSSKNTNQDLPWKDFDTNTPIAEIVPTANGGIEVDWKGFTINGKLAIDYAIFGKKTLEGKYKRQQNE